MLGYGGMFVGTAIALLVLSIPISLTLGFAVATVNWTAASVHFTVSRTAIGAMAVVSVLVCVVVFFAFQVIDQQFAPHSKGSIFRFYPLAQQLSVFLIFAQFFSGRVYAKQPSTYLEAKVRYGWSISVAIVPTAALAIGTYLWRS
jgi:hypothetical protein